MISRYHAKTVYVLKGFGSDFEESDESEWIVGIFSDRNEAENRKEDLEDLFENITDEYSSIGEFVRKHKNGDKKAKDNTNYEIELAKFYG